MDSEPDTIPDRLFRFNNCSAFRAIAGEPKPIATNTGCKFPIHAGEIIDIGSAPSTLLQCGAPRHSDPNRIHPYCQDHCRIAYREWEDRKSKAIRASKRVAHLPR